MTALLLPPSLVFHKIGQDCRAVGYDVYSHDTLPDTLDDIIIVRVTNDDWESKAVKLIATLIPCAELVVVDGQYAYIEYLGQRLVEWPINGEPLQPSLYVWPRFGHDATGLAFAIALTERQAKQAIRQKFGRALPDDFGNVAAIWGRPEKFPLDAAIGIGFWCQPE